MTQGVAPLLSVQLCTHDRKTLLRRVLDALFEQSADKDEYEIVLVDDGSTDGTYESVIARLQPTCALHVVRQPNAGLARSRNAGIARTRARILLFMDDDVIATPNLVSAHLRFHAAHARTICRGGVINVASLSALPAAKYGWRNYSGAYFWTTNVSVPKELIEKAGAFDERFKEYGWEDLELGLRLRKMGVGSALERDALVYHYKPPRANPDFERMKVQARAQARTAVLFIRKHPHWRVALATGQLAPLLWWSAAVQAVGWTWLLRKLGGDAPAGAGTLQRWAAARLVRAAYYDELRKAAQRS